MFSSHQPMWCVGVCGVHGPSIYMLGFLIPTPHATYICKCSLQMTQRTMCSLEGGVMLFFHSIGLCGDGVHCCVHVYSMHMHQEIVNMPCANYMRKGVYDYHGIQYICLNVVWLFITFPCAVILWVCLWLVVAVLHFAALSGVRWYHRHALGLGLCKNRANQPNQPNRPIQFGSVSNLLRFGFGSKIY